MDRHPNEHGLADVVALVVILVASALAANLIWLLTTRPDALVSALASADGLWGIVTAVAGRVLAII